MQAEYFIAMINDIGSNNLPALPRHAMNKNPGFVLLTLLCKEKRILQV